MSRKLYVAPISETGQRSESNQREALRNLASKGLLDQDNTVVEGLSTDPGDVTLDGQYRGQYADLMAAELAELAESSGYASLPYFGLDGKTPEDGYYSLENISKTRIVERSDKAQRYRGSLKKVGTRRSHYRSVRTTQRSLTTPFGSTSTAEVGVPAAASDVRWVNTETGKTASATVQATRTTEFGDVGIYHQGSPSITDPSLIYDIAYDDEAGTDVRVFDGQGNSSREDGNGNVQWQKVFTSTHNYDSDNIIISNGLLRLTFDEANNSLSAETYGSGSWSSKSLGASSWQLSSIDIGHRPDQDLSPVTVDALTRWEDSNSSSTHELDMSLQRGLQNALFYRLPDSSNSVPSGLQTLLDPIASSSDLDAQPVRTLRKRAKVTEDG